MIYKIICAEIFKEYVLQWEEMFVDGDIIMLAIVTIGGANKNKDGVNGQAQVEEMTLMECAIQ